MWDHRLWNIIQHYYLQQAKLQEIIEQEERAGRTVTAKKIRCLRCTNEWTSTTPTSSSLEPRILAYRGSKWVMFTVNFPLCFVYLFKSTWIYFHAFILSRPSECLHRKRCMMHDINRKAAYYCHWLAFIFLRWNFHGRNFREHTHGYMKIPIMKIPTMESSNHGKVPTMGKFQPWKVLPMKDFTHTIFHPKEINPTYGAKF